MVVTIDDKGGVYVNDVWRRVEQLEEALTQEMRNKGTSSVYLRADSTIAYGNVIDVIGRMKEMGIEDIGLVTEHEEKKEGR